MVVIVLKISLALFCPALNWMVLSNNPFQHIQITKNTFQLLVYLGCSQTFFF